MATVKRTKISRWKRTGIFTLLIVLALCALALITGSRLTDSTTSIALLEYASSETAKVTTPAESIPESPMPVQLSLLSPSGANAESMPVRMFTDAGVDVSDPELWDGEDLHGDSSTATVMGMATGFDLSVYKRFVGSLRKTGYKGHIILGVSPDVHATILEYFLHRNVTVKFIRSGECTYKKPASEKDDIFKKTICDANYPDIKVRWSRFPLQADWLRECKTCTGPVLTMDVRDSIFQQDPFGPGSGVIKGLQVFEEDPSQTTLHWLTKWPISECKGLTIEKTMLCSGTTVGTRKAILKYFEAMHAEMKVWISDEKCRFDIDGDDQSIHNYLFYTGQLPFAKAIRNRSGGIVNTVGKIGADLRKKYLKYVEEVHKLSPQEAAERPYEGASEKTWIGTEFNLTDENGLFIEADGSLSRVVHQFDRFGIPFSTWLMKQEFVKDDYPGRNTQNQTTSQIEGGQEQNTEGEGAVNPPQLNTQNQKTSQIKSGQEQKAEGEGALNLPERRTTTETGVDISDPQLWEGEELHGDSSTATVMGMASGYDMNVYQRFVGTLRKSGFKGKIILGVAPDVSQEVLDYFKIRDVTPKILHWANCTYRKIESKKDIFNKTTCEEHYPDIKIRWSRFPLQADWLRECTECTGPVLVMDVRDSYFQLDPFGPGSPPVKGLQVFEEHPSQTTDHWLTKWPISACKGISFTKPMLCSGTTIGTRAAMLKYLDIMYEEMKVWITEEKCRFDIDGDDQSIHNYLYYTGQLPFAKAVEFRDGGIVTTVGKLGAMVVKAHANHLLETKGMEKGEAMWQPFPGATSTNWVGAAYNLTHNLTDSEGFFLEKDGTRSRVIHQWDRFGRPLVNLWMDKNPYFRDGVDKK